MSIFIPIAIIGGTIAIIKGTEKAVKHVEKKKKRKQQRRLEQRRLERLDPKYTPTPIHEDLYNVGPKGNAAITPL